MRPNNPKIINSIERAAILARGISIDVFANGLNPLHPNSALSWNDLSFKACNVAKAQIGQLIAPDLWPGAREGILSTAGHEAHAQFELLLAQSGVRDWMNR